MNKSLNELKLNNYKNWIISDLILNQAKNFPKFNPGDIFRKEIVDKENKKIEGRGMNPAKYEKQVWNIKCIINRAEELADECYYKVLSF